MEALMYTTTTYEASGHKVMPHKRTHELLELFTVTGPWRVIKDASRKAQHRISRDRHEIMDRLRRVRNVCQG